MRHLMERERRRERIPDIRDRVAYPAAAGVMFAVILGALMTVGLRYPVVPLLSDGLLGLGRPWIFVAVVVLIMSVWFPFRVLYERFIGDRLPVELLGAGDGPTGRSMEQWRGLRDAMVNVEADRVVRGFDAILGRDRPGRTDPAAGEGFAHLRRQIAHRRRRVWLIILAIVVDAALTFWFAWGSSAGSSTLYWLLGAGGMAALSSFRFDHETAIVELWTDWYETTRRTATQ